MVGDYVLAVNGTDVTSIPHSEAANLARQGMYGNPKAWFSLPRRPLPDRDLLDLAGPDLLTLTIGSDIARYPSSPRPACRGYLYKRTQSGLIKGWRKRWFVLTHDCCLYYYRHRRVSSAVAATFKKSPSKEEDSRTADAYRTKASRGPCTQSDWRGPRSGPTRPWENPSSSGAALRLLPESSSSAPPAARR